MALHKDLTGDDLHEPKGITTAPSGSSYLSNGTGSGSWRKPGLADLDRTNATGLNFTSQSLRHTSIRTNNKAAYATIAFAGSLVRISGIIDSSPTEDITITFTRNGTVAIGSVLIAAASAEGSQVSFNILPTVAFSQGEFVKALATGGTSSTSPVILDVQLVFAI